MTASHSSGNPGNPRIAFLSKWEEIGVLGKACGAMEVLEVGAGKDRWAVAGLVGLQGVQLPSLSSVSVQKPLLALARAEQSSLAALGKMCISPS